MAVNTDSTVDQIKSRCDLVDLIGEYLRLEKKGNNYVALCPFHQEKTPSFTVSPEKQLYYCFGCGEGGDHFKFIRKMENLDFPEALRLLAQKTGITLPERSSSTTGASIMDKLFGLNHLAMQFFSYVLNSTGEGERAREYLNKRGINKNAVDRFKLGFAPDRWDAFLKVAQKKGYNEELLLKGGLIASRKDNTGYYDRFRNRLMFPIMDLRGRIVGFGGRILEESRRAPKYLNSPETPLFDKGKYLYGIYQAKESLRKQGQAILVEGYTDVIALHQEGLDNTVATLGTALTPAQSRLLRQQADSVVTAFDSDEGGLSATLRGLGILQKAGLQIKVADFPYGKDPEEYLKEKGRDAFQELIEGSEPLMDYQFRLLRQKYDLNSAEGKNKFAEEFFAVLNEFCSELEKEHYLKQASEVLKVAEGVLRNELKKYQRRKRVPEKNSNNLNINGKNNVIQDHVLDPAEELLLKLFLSYEGVLERIGEFQKTSPDNQDEVDFFSKDMQKIIEACRNLKENGEKVRVSSLLNKISDEFMQKLITRASFDSRWGDLSPAEVNKMTEDCIRKLKKTRLTEQRVKIESEIKKLEQSGDRQKIKKLLQEWESLKRKERELYSGLEKEGWSW